MLAATKHLITTSYIFSDSVFFGLCVNGHKLPDAVVLKNFLL
nr:MAG TPA: hypothetical protein [Caudoviricetes sp.]DAX10790.1 MAG TPA: hypothetical protein [Bacteriophage sp.]